VLGLALAWLAGFGLDRLRHAEAELRTRILKRAAATLLVLTAAGLGVAWTMPYWPDRPGATYPGFWIPAVSALVCIGVLALTAQRSRRQVWVAAVVPVLAFVELCSSLGVRHSAPALEVLTRPECFPEPVRWLREHASAGVPTRCLIAPDVWHARGQDWGVPAALGSPWGLSSLSGYSQSMPQSLGRLLWLSPVGWSDCAAVLAEERGLSAVGGQYVVARGLKAEARKQKAEGGGLHPPSAFCLLPSAFNVVARFDSDVCIYENPNARSLATLVKEVRLVPSDDEAVRHILQPGRPVKELTYLAIPGAFAADLELIGSLQFAPGRADIASYQANDIRIQTDAPGQAFLVLAVTRCLGWTATVDGVKTPIHAVDGPLMGVTVPPGAHTVRFTYRPVLAWAGLLAGVLTLGGFWLVVLLGVLRRWRSPYAVPGSVQQQKSPRSGARAA
jgi:hypothetical protein